MIPKRDPDLKLAGLLIWVLDRQFAGSDDYWDGNWLDVVVRVEAQGAVVTAGGSILRTDEINRFVEELSAVSQTLGGTAELACLEPELQAKVTCGSLGHMELVVEITPDHLTQSHRFEFGIDQSYLASFVREGRKLLRAYPIKGTAESGEA